MEEMSIGGSVPIFSCQRFMGAGDFVPSMYIFYCTELVLYFLASS